MIGPVFKDGNAFTAVSGLEKTGYSIRDALLTKLGTRPNLPTFGSKLYLLQFSPITEVLIDLSCVYIQECMDNSVPSVAIVSIETEVNYESRTIYYDIKFKDNESGRVGTTSILFNNGVYE